MFGAIASSVASVGSTLLKNHSAKKEAQRNRDFQEEMSNTSIQRRMADLKAAGLNPLLAVSSANSGASTPSGSQADISGLDSSIISAVSNAYLASKQGKVAEAEERRINADAERIEMDNTLFEQKRDKAILDNVMLFHKIDTEKLTHKLMGTQNEKLQTEILVDTFRAKGIDIDNRQAEIVLEMMKKEAGAWRNTTTAHNIDYGMEKTGQFLDLVGKVLDWIPFVDITSQTDPRGRSTITKHERRWRF